MKIVPSLLAAALGLACAGAAHADRGHGHARFGVVIGAPVIGPYWGPYAYPAYPAYPTYPYYPPVVVERPAPQVYIEQQPVAAPPAAAPAPAESYWYYCAESRTYYPYVKECAGPWQRVTPQPPPTSSAPR